MVIRTGKRSSKSDELVGTSEDDAVEAPVAKKAKVKKESKAPAPEASTSTGLLKNDDGDSFVEIGKGGLRRVTVRTYKKSVQIDIREMYEKDGKILPGKKGLSMTVEQFEALKAAIGDIDQAVAALS